MDLVDYVIKNANSIPNVVGELLRDFFFDQSGGRGCYSTFKTHLEVKEEQKEPIPWFDFVNGESIYVQDRVDPDDPNKIYHVFSRERIKMKYHWGNDGVLLFVLPDKSVLINSDCKKDKNWRWYKNEDSLWFEYM